MLIHWCWEPYPRSGRVSMHNVESFGPNHVSHLSRRTNGCKTGVQQGRPSPTFLFPVDPRLEAHSERGMWLQRVVPGLPTASSS